MADPPVSVGGIWMRLSPGNLFSARATSTDIVIDYEHQTLNAEKNGQPAPAAGWFRDMEWREGDGLYAVGVKWTDTASRMLAAKEYRHISPTFEYNNSTSGIVQRIVNAALTNNPALDGLTDLALASRRHTERPPTESSAINGELAAAYQKLSQTFGIPMEQLTAGVERDRQQNPLTRRLTSDERAATNADLRRMFGVGAYQIPE